MNELEAIREFIIQEHPMDSIVLMQETLDHAIGFSQRVGELANQRELEFHLQYAEKLSELGRMEEETETMRKAKLNGWTAEAKKDLSDLKTLLGSLKSLRMMLMQAIKTRREEPH